MKLLRDFVWLRALRRLRAGRAAAARRPYTVTVPAPLAAPAGQVVELRRHAEAHPPQASRGSLSTPLARAVNQ
jgi:hypothetical protein